MLGLWPAERGAFWEAVSCGQSLWGDAVWLIGLSWSAHKALCPRLIHPALHGQIKGEGHRGGVFWGESFFNHLFLSHSGLFSIGGARVSELHVNRVLLASSNTKQRKTAAQHGLTP